ncbi:MAG: UDP-N-acetylmuramoyl-L-alanyl-D-glutamate--2,6-diaminopimelate ligase [Candidatus Krumholzibacteria bacterium]|jgi:UDP-N-acetylmuramoyl-L-alanyl-D-glutamate--2,6-diaminopimelate ligase|nr:UDP-N-acetylmuramoyl-L-alanyl-D-glutamate--2,6-diaminopimelate ligase [Candidatus Krumholzibacteria bacterium]MDP6797880.1 UDP-N-acetylmuramoyl-L-alanyl-D-glutamate--2,6-diaminopimelate ligase [Candidatus Krumholzibacteria bacterium]MDP7021621.1 UDP-N-acetylmuramoyl-L-alanyl-D-glutamate--2,6-diaminopimelate ligase [Candidatus Krumholzibacteria bacterium]
MSRIWTLEELCHALSHCRREGGPASISGISFDSREVRSGDLFAALPGVQSEGLDYLEQALSRGAVAVLAPSTATLPRDLPALLCDYPAESAGQVAHLLAGNPSRDWPLLAVTGTNGKSSSVFLLRHLLGQEEEWGMLGSLSYETGLRKEESSHTTPDALRLSTFLREMRDSGFAGAVMEASSHALEQSRLAGCKVHAALFTNLSRDHLDYHGSMEDYFEAKLLLLGLLGDRAPCLYNRDDEWMKQVGKVHPGALSFGHHKEADYRILEEDCSAEGSRMRMSFAGEGERDFFSPLPGRFNGMNVAGALALAHAMGRDKDLLIDCLPTFVGVPGRMESWRLPSGARVLIDFAHTPDAVEKVCLAARPLCRGTLRILIGAGGDRDRGKRPQMAALAASFGDHLILSSDNPRSEDPERILDDMESGLDSSKYSWQRISSRSEAIARACAECEDGDLLLLLGKGDETCQEIAGERIPFRDSEEVQKAGGRSD